MRVSAHQAVLVYIDAITGEHLAEDSTGHLSSLTEHAHLTKIRHHTRTYILYDLAASFHPLLSMLP